MSAYPKSFCKTEKVSEYAVFKICARKITLKACHGGPDHFSLYEGTAHENFQARGIKTLCRVKNYAYGLRIGREGYKIDITDPENVWRISL